VQKKNVANLYFDEWCSLQVNYVHNHVQQGCTRSTWVLLTIAWIQMFWLEMPIQQRNCLWFGRHQRQLLVLDFHSFLASWPWDRWKKTPAQGCFVSNLRVCFRANSPGATTKSEKNGCWVHSGTLEASTIGLHTEGCFYRSAVGGWFQSKALSSNHLKPTSTNANKVSQVRFGFQF